MIITLSGLPGSGKSTIKRLLAERLGLKAYSIGDLRGQMAKERGLTIDELNAEGMEDPESDRTVDAFQKKLGETEDNFIIDGWLSPFMIPKSKKVFLDVDLKEAAQRIFEDRKNNPNRADEPEYSSPEETERVITDRLKQTRERYQKWYGIDFLDKTAYDLVIDTTHLSPDEVAAAIDQ